MRVVINPQMQFGQVDISKIELDPKSRDDIPQILRGLQFIYSDQETREAIFALLTEEISPKTSKTNGRPGMDLWKILVLGALRVNLNLDYDKLQEYANKHIDVRYMLGHSEKWALERYYYEMQTLKDNIRLLTPELLDKVNQLVVKAGYKLVKKKDEAPLHGRCDSFVVETDVHYPTDINLLLDATRTVIRLTADLCERRNLSDWRQSSYNIRCLKKSERAAQTSKKTRKSKANKLAATATATATVTATAAAKATAVATKAAAAAASYNDKMKSAYIEYINMSQLYLDKASATLKKLEKEDFTPIEISIVENILTFIGHGDRQIEQINRRIILGETIPHEEKVFSLFKPYTEWISKGKAGVPVELGVRVCIMEDQHQFITHHKVMEKQTDDEIALEMVQETKRKHGAVASVSFDKGYHSVDNQKRLSAELELVVLPTKGKLSQDRKLIEHAEDFRAARKQHSAVESAINALEVHGLDCCPDYGIESFKRYVALAVLGRNIQLVGVILRKKEQKTAQKQKNNTYHKIYKKAA